MGPGTLLRAFLVGYYRLRLRAVGRNFRLGLGSVILNPGDVRIGDDVFLGPGTYISSPTSVEIGDRVMFGPHVMVIGGDHDLDNLAIPLRFAPAPPNPPPVVIEEDAWIGARTVILKGVTIGRGAVVGAGSVVTRSVAANTVVAGNPAKFIRARGSQGTAEP